MRRRNRRGAPPPPPAAAQAAPRVRICLEPSGSASQSGPHGFPSARGFSSSWLCGQLPLAGLGRQARKAAVERWAVCSCSSRTHPSPPSLRVSGPCWDSGHQQLSGECGRGVPWEGSRRGHRGTRARRARNFLGSFPRRPAGSPRPPARPRAGGGRERSLRRLHPALSQ